MTWTSTMVLTIAYGRCLGDVKLGELFLAITFVGLIGFPLDGGFNEQLIRDVSQDQSKALRYLTNILCFKIILWGVLYGCIILLSWLLGYSSEVRLLVSICGITLLTSSITSLMSSIHYTFERVMFPVLGNILEKGFNALVGATLLYKGADVQIMAWILLSGSCVSMLWQSFWVLRLVGIPYIFDFPLARKLVKTSIPFILYGALAVIYYRIDTVLLSKMASEEVIGWYGAAYRIFDTLVFLPSLIIGPIMYPIFSKLSEHSEKELKAAVEKATNFLLFFGIPIATGLIVVAPNIVGFLYNRSDFNNSIPAMQYLAPGLLFLYINSVLNSVIISTGREKKIPIMAAIALVFNLGLNLFLLPTYQHVGAALVTTLTELLLGIISLIIIPRSLWPLGSIKVALKALLAALMMGVVVWFMQQYTLLIILPVAGLVYFSAATLIGTIPRDDMKALYAAIRHKTGGSEADGDEDERTHSGTLFLTDVDMQGEQEFLLALGHEMTNPILPAFKSNMTSPVLPAYRVEMTTLLPTYKQHPGTSHLSGIMNQATMRLSDYSRIDEISNQATIRLPNTPLPPRIDEISNQATIRLPNTPLPPRIDEQATLPLIEALRPTKTEN